MTYSGRYPSSLYPRNSRSLMVHHRGQSPSTPPSDRGGAGDARPSSLMYFSLASHVPESVFRVKCVPYVPIKIIHCPHKLLTQSDTNVPGVGAVGTKMDMSQNSEKSHALAILGGMEYLDINGYLKCGLLFVPQLNSSNFVKRLRGLRFCPRIALCPHIVGVYS